MKAIVKLILLLCVINTYSQNSISGKITDGTTNDIISWADVILYQGETIVTAVITNDKGEFSLENIKDGAYKLKTHYLGYKEYSADFELKNNEKKQFSIQLESDASELDEVVIIAEKTTIQHRSDRKIVNLGKDLLSSGAAATDIFNKLPSVKVSVDGNVSLRGDQNVKILVNGKSQSLPNDRLLQQIPSSAISKIEIITNPSAKYEAAGVSGIINIITKRKYNIGGKINLSTAIGTGKELRANSNIDISYATKKIKTYVNYSYNKSIWDTKEISNNERESIKFENQQNQLSFNKTPYLKGGLDFFIDSTSALSVSASLSKYSFASSGKNNIIETSLLDNTITNSIFKLESKSTGNNNDFNINYRKELNGSDHYIEADANYSFSPFKFNSDRKTDRDNSTTTELQGDNLIDSSNITTLNLDYYKNTEKSTLELGLRSELRNLEKSQNFYMITQTETQTNTNYKYNDGIYAAYGVYDRQFGDLSIKGGLRLEHTAFNLKNNDNTIKSDYTDLFPSLSASFNKNGHKLSLNYSRRISRPSVWHISNTIFTFSQYSQFSGNPDLKPEYANKMEFNYYKKFEKFNLNSSIFYTGVSDVITFVTTINGNNAINYFDNVGKSQNYGLELYSRINLFNWWDATVDATYYFKKFKNQSFLNTKTFNHEYNINNTFKPFNGVSVQANFGIRPKNVGLQNTTKGFSYTDLAISKDLFNKKGQIILRVNDIFDSKKRTNYGEVNGFSFNSVSQSPSSRHLYVTFKYNLSFGNKNITDKNRNRKDRDYTKRQ
ncbi:hypothetical protein CXF68_14290 [Tenacibaculum sp. Bg11-29]|uniref:outer membrane beta-barrel family protein n=1 Tax=Tenacibaculum sp. Bg11-29 TaxID=2058306 RepID=UPI000C333C0A|nr:outer membrane beta-barrel family protein [Tenacibaculum sp. Bg11-29]PKH51782.1 hypothetical protein CXF68_14290 [Tenacibaculum sp. Bg11-29]